MKPNPYSVQTQPKLGPQAVALTTSKAGSCYIGRLNVNIYMYIYIGYISLSTYVPRSDCRAYVVMTYRTQRQRGENGPSLGYNIGHDFFPASEGRKEMGRRESILFRCLILLCSIWKAYIYKVWFVGSWVLGVRGFDRDTSQSVS